MPTTSSASSDRLALSVFKYPSSSHSAKATPTGFRERYGSEKIDPEEIRVLNLRCGYLEAPVNFEQDLLRPGCLVSFSVGESRSDIADQLMLALEEGGRLEDLLGTQASVASGK